MGLCLWQQTKLFLSAQARPQSPSCHLLPNPHSQVFLKTPRECLCRGHVSHLSLGVSQDTAPAADKVSWNPLRATTHLPFWQACHTKARRLNAKGSKWWVLKGFHSLWVTVYKQFSAYRLLWIQLYLRRMWGQRCHTSGDGEVAPESACDVWLLLHKARGFSQEAPQHVMQMIVADRHLSARHAHPGLDPAVGPLSEHPAVSKRCLNRNGHIILLSGYQSPHT